MKVLVVPSWYPSAEQPTAGIFVAQQVRGLAAQGVEVAVLFHAEQHDSNGPEFAVEEGIPTVRTGWPPSSRRSLLARRLGTLYRLVAVRLPAFKNRVKIALDELVERGFEPDVIHVHALWPAAAAAVVASERFGVPIVITEHSEEYLPGTERLLVRMPGVLPLVLRPLARRMAAYIAVSRHLGDRLRELGLSDDIRVIPNVVPARSTVEPIQTVEPKHILHVSQLGPAKNIPLLLNAVGAVRQRRQDFVLDIAGDSPFRSDAEQLASDLGILDTAVHFLGRLSPRGVNEALDRSAFAVLSSRHENSSVFAAETLMAGRPLLTTACGGHVEYLDETLGLVVENESVSALADGIDWMLDHHGEFEPERLNAFARERFSEQVITRQLLSVYQEVLSR